jgi:hypothetical protein
VSKGEKKSERRSWCENEVLIIESLWRFVKVNFLQKMLLKYYLKFDQQKIKSKFKNPTSKPKPHSRANQ